MATRLGLFGFDRWIRMFRSSDMGRCLMPVTEAVISSPPYSGVRVRRASPTSERRKDEHDAVSGVIGPVPWPRLPRCSGCSTAT